MNVYIVITAKKDGKYISYVSELHYGDNLKSYWCFHDTEVEDITAFKTKKEAERTARFWNDGYRQKGVLL